MCCVIRGIRGQKSKHLSHISKTNIVKTNLEKKMIRFMFITLINHQNFVKFSFDTEKKGDWSLKLGTKGSLKFFFHSTLQIILVFDML